MILKYSVNNQYLTLTKYYSDNHFFVYPFSITLIISSPIKIA
jgi:hypothetical protein